MTRDQLKARILEAIDRRAPEIIAIGERIRKNPELSFKEVKTARLADGAAGAREVLGKAKRPLTRAGYLELQRGMARREVYEGR